MKEKMSETAIDATANTPRASRALTKAVLSSCEEAKLKIRAIAMTAPIKTAINPVITKVVLRLFPIP